MDGTLLDSIHIWLESEQVVLDEVGVQLSKEERDELNALTLEQAGDFFHERFGIMGSGEEVVGLIVEQMLKFYRSSVRAKPGAVDFVRAVRAAGHPMCVMSSSPQSFLQAGLGTAGIKDLFEPELIVSAEDMGVTKRAPEAFERVCEALGCAPEDTWLFDDSWYALATAHGLGIHTVGVHSNDSCGTREELGRYCKTVVEDFTELDVADYL